LKGGRTILKRREDNSHEQKKVVLRNNKGENGTDIPEKKKKGRRKVREGK